MKEKGYNIKKVTINVGTSYNAVGEALSSGSVDMGFISGATYVMYDNDVDVLLTALRQGMSQRLAVFFHSHSFQCRQRFFFFHPREET